MKYRDNSYTHWPIAFADKIAYNERMAMPGKKLSLAERIAQQQIASSGVAAASVAADAAADAVQKDVKADVDIDVDAELQPQEANAAAQKIDIADEHTGEGFSNRGITKGNQKDAKEELANSGMPIKSFFKRGRGRPKKS